VLALGVEGVGGDDGVGEVQTLQQRPEPGDLVGGVVHVGLGQDRGGGMIHRREQVHRRGAVVAAAAQGLAVDGDGALWRWWPAGGRGWLLAGQPLADGPVQRVGVDAGQHAAHGRLSGWPEGAGQRVAAGPERGKDLAGRIRGPLADRGQRLGAGQHRADRDAEHADQRGPSAASMSWVGDAGKVVEQAAALVGCQHGERGRMGARGNGGWWAGRHGGPVWS
jgi:hypothetical protein